MNKKNKPDKHGFVYSTDPNFNFNPEAAPTANTLPAEQQKLRIRLDTRQRAGKTVTLITDFAGTEEDLQHLGKQLKNVCGTGGSAKDNEMIVQGDQRDKVLQWLLRNGYIGTKKM